MAEILLRGCQPEPIQSYLKALGVFRLLSEQVSPRIRGSWSPDGFVLSGPIDPDGLVDYFLTRYRPTPLVAPWNGGSGFYDGDATDGIDAIANSSDSRFALYRQVIRTIRAMPELAAVPPTAIEVIAAMERQRDSLAPGKARADIERLLDDVATARAAVEGTGRTGIETLSRASVDNESSDKGAGRELKSWTKAVDKLVTAYKRLQRGGGKTDLMVACRDRLPDEVLSWLDAAFLLTSSVQGDLEPDYAAILGSGGNEGRLDYTNNFMRHVAALVGGSEAASDHLRSALFGELASGLSNGASGQFDPGRAGGCNQGAGFEAACAPFNRWDYVLGLEGTLMLAGAVARRFGAAAGAKSSPFSVFISASGFDSCADEDGRGRAETWLPLWDRPATLAEVRHLFAEARATVGNRPTRNGLDFARAVSTLGVDRGISAFVRYGFLKRRGDSYVAYPMARIPVRFNPQALLLADLDPLLQDIHRLLGSFQNAPASLVAARNLLDDALFRMTTRGDASDCQDVIVALGRFQRFLAVKPVTSRPLPARLGAGWLEAIDDGSLDVRIAASLASVLPDPKGIGPIVANLLPVDPGRPWTWATGVGQQAWEGRTFADRVASVLHRRMLDAERIGTPNVPCAGRIGLACSDVAAFISEANDDDRTENLLWGLTLVQWSQVHSPAAWSTPVRPLPIPRVFAAMKLLFLSTEVRGVRPAPEPRLVPLLIGGRVAEAVRAARGRLVTSSLGPRALDPDAPGLCPVRMAAALLLPVRDPVRMVSLALKAEEMN